MSTRTTFAGGLLEQHAGERAYCIVYHQDHSWHVDLRRDEVLEIGRSRSCGVHLPDDKASRVHATLTWDGMRLVLRDLDSTNGTQVNGTPIRGEATLRSGDEITIGGAVVVVGLTAPAGGAGRRVLAHADFEERLAEEVARARRYRRSAALLMVRLPGPGPAPEEAVREMDVLGAYGPQDLEVLLPEVDGTGAREAAERILAAVPRCRLGVAMFPADATDRERMVAAARAALRATTLAEPIVRARAETLPETTAPVAADPAMQRVLALVERVAPRDIAVLVTGETGVGKEIVAREIHRRGRGANRPFVAVNCAALPETIVDSELFGHEKGAFTGAAARKKGLFEAAQGGTLFLDEIGELALTTQAHLLRVLERREVLRVGATEPVAVDTRVVAATHRDLDKEVKRGAFREDLLFRLNAFALLVPPLRDRPADLEALSARFLTEAARSAGRGRMELTPAARAALMSYGWPGNVRELHNAIERAALIAEGDRIDVADLPERVRTTGGTARSGAVLKDSIDALEHEALVKALESCDGNQTRAARALGISRRTLIYKIRKYGLKRR
jgi:two-component system, NtrC family, response regulator AtoC